MSVDDTFEAMPRERRVCHTRQLPATRSARRLGRQAMRATAVMLIGVFAAVCVSTPVPSPAALLTP